MGSPWFEDLQVGTTYDCGTTHVTADEMLEFASRYDPLPIHADPEAAARSEYGGLIASGAHTLALSTRLVAENFYRDSGLVASVGLEHVEFTNPLRPDETIAVRVTVTDCRPSSSNPEWGVVTTERTVTTEGGCQVLTLDNTTVWRRDPVRTADGPDRRGGE